MQKANRTDKIKSDDELIFFMIHNNINTGGNSVVRCLWVYTPWSIHSSWRRSFCVLELLLLLYAVFTSLQHSFVVGFVLQCALLNQALPWSTIYQCHISDWSPAFHPVYTKPKYTCRHAERNANRGLVTLFQTLFRQSESSFYVAHWCRNQQKWAGDLWKTLSLDWISQSER